MGAKKAALDLEAKGPVGGFRLFKVGAIFEEQRVVTEKEYAALSLPVFSLLFSPT